MLDWIMLRRHGVRVTLPEEAENLFSSLSEFNGVGKFVKPASLKAELRPYQEAVSYTHLTLPTNREV